MTQAIKRKVDLVACGAASDGIIETAAMEVIEPYVDVMRSGGASAGGLIGLGEAAGIPHAEMLTFWKRFLADGKLEDWKSFVPGPGRLLGIRKGPGYGMIYGREIRDRLGQIFGKMQMGELLKPCRVRVGHLNKKKTITIDSENPSHKKLLVADVGMAGSSVPFVIDARPIEPGGKDMFTDGGLTDNVPRNLWDDHPDRHTLVLSFSEREAWAPVTSLKQFAMSVFNLQRDASEDSRSAKPAWKIWECKLPSSGGALDFSLDEKECDRRIELGRTAALAFVSGMIASGLFEQSTIKRG
jgi:predicted acylesterase/phospholipase RssA